MKLRFAIEDVRISMVCYGRKYCPDRQQPVARFVNFLLPIRQVIRISHRRRKQRSVSQQGRFATLRKSRCTRELPFQMAIYKEATIDCR